MSNDSELVSLEEAISKVELAINRVTPLHLSFAKILIDELGEERGSELVIKSIIEYGKRIAERVEHGKGDLPRRVVNMGDILKDTEGHFVVTGLI